MTIVVPSDTNTRADRTLLSKSGNQGSFPKVPKEELRTVEVMIMPELEP